MGRDAATSDGATTGSSNKRTKHQNDVSSKSIDKQNYEIAVIDLTIEDPVHPITEAEYQKMEVFLGQFYRSPLSEEFTKPISALYPDDPNVRLHHRSIDVAVALAMQLSYDFVFL